MEPRGVRMVRAVLVVSCLLGTSSAAIKTQLEFPFREESAPGALVGNIGEEAGLREHYGADIFRTLKFSFLDTTAEHVDLFSIQEDGGALLTAKRIDRDIICPRQPKCEIQINIRTKPDDQMHIIKVLLDITDLNDNAPSFPQPFITRSISEASAFPGSKISLPGATDPDSPRYGVQRYTLSGGEGRFRLLQSNNTGASIDISLELLEQLDREAQSTHRVQVVAHDGGPEPNTGTVSVTITVLDINDNNPKFDNQSYRVSIPENAPLGRSVISVHASDPDEGEYGEIIYGLESDGIIPFWINATSGEVVVNGEVDHEIRSVYSLTVTAKNRDPDSTTSSAKLIIQVEDENDNPPLIKVSGDGRVEIPENVMAGRFVAHLTIADPDSAGGNKRFSCSLDPASTARFSLEQIFETEYKIVTKGRFDRESESQYEVVLTCRDQGVPQQVSQHRITVRVTDENDNYPVFSMTTYVSGVIENNAIGANLLQVTAADRDAGANRKVTYSVEDKAKDAVKVNPDTGNISSKVSFDYEQLQRYEFKVFATDGGVPAQTSTATVVVIIQDDDDEVPRFSRGVYNFSVMEDQPPGTDIAPVSAVDRDSEPFNKFSYSISPSQEGQLGNSSSVLDKFSIDKKSGMISTRKLLNREDNEMYKLVILATSDRSKPYVTSSATVILTVLDKNDNSPYVTYPNAYNNTLFLSNQLPEDTYLMKVEAFDADAGDNAVLLYHITAGDPDHHFSIDEQTGEVFVKSDLSDISYQSFALRISVSDSGTPPRAVEAMLNIVVNHSIPFGESSMLTKQNLTIVIAIASISGLIMVVLVIAIVAILRQQRHVPTPKNKFASRVEQKFVGQELQTPVSVPVMNNTDKLREMSAGGGGREYQERPRGEGYPETGGTGGGSRPQVTSVSSSPSSYSSQGKTGPLSVSVTPKDSDNSSDITDSGRGSSEDVGYKKHLQLPRTSTTVNDPCLPPRSQTGRQSNRSRHSSGPRVKHKDPAPPPGQQHPPGYPGYYPPQSPPKPKRLGIVGYNSGLYGDRNSYHSDAGKQNNLPNNFIGGAGGGMGGGELKVLDQPSKTPCRGCENCNGNGACCYGSYV